jgi:hypothetical protein
MKGWIYVLALLVVCSVCMFPVLADSDDQMTVSFSSICVFLVSLMCLCLQTGNQCNGEVCTDTTNERVIGCCYASGCCYSPNGDDDGAHYCKDDGTCGRHMTESAMAVIILFSALGGVCVCGCCATGIYLAYVKMLPKNPAGAGNQPSQEMPSSPPSPGGIQMPSAPPLGYYPVPSYSNSTAEYTQMQKNSYPLTDSIRPMPSKSYPMAVPIRAEQAGVPIATVVPGSSQDVAVVAYRL